jgi:(1->4)-alpha-D-glucan 1-alpha-D-glucosylmutase
VPEPAPARPAGHRPPDSTYRLQLTAEFGFASAASIAGYLAGLGVSHVYLSPILQAARGSQHGYDVVDHSLVCADLGGEAGFRDMVAEFRRHGLGVVVDIVPNHMGIAAPESANRQFWSVLTHGPASPYAHWFDIDWAARGNRLLLPILAGPVAESAADLTADHTPDTGPVLRYYDHVLPLAAGTADLPLLDLLAAQHYELADWRTANTDLNWRRFFDITTLIAIQPQHEDVFTATHEVLLRLLAEGLIDGLRIDHPDGLANPRDYLQRLAAATGGCWVVTEKILTGNEQLPGDWPCAGTTGYDALGKVGALFTDPAGATPLTTGYVEFTGASPSFDPVATAAKHEIVTNSLAAEVTRLARVAAGTATETDLRTVLAQLLCAMPVYRAYVTPGEPPPAASVDLLTAAAQHARTNLPPHLHKLLDTLTELLLTPGELATRFQQTSGPVMAKGVEDTAFYRWSRLVSLNEVGGEPGHLGDAPEAFHAFATRLARDWPATMTTLSTHDTKRGEDLRARLAVLAEIPAAWAAEAAAWHDRARILTDRLPEPDTEYLLWQTLLGAWPIAADRLTQYLLKAMREAKSRTSWTSPDQDYEDSVLRLAEAILADPELTGRITAFVAAIDPDAQASSLGAKLVQLTMPGVPDTYQGCELASFPLVDPDNRRPVDFARRVGLLAAIDGPVPDDLDRRKLLVTTRALRLRRAHPGWFGGDYQALTADGPAAGHVVAFARGGRAVTIATRLPATLRHRGGWAGTTLELPASPGSSQWRDLLTGATYTTPRATLAQLTTRLPVALLAAS